MSEPAFSKIAIIGIGLIGASIALAVKHRGIGSKIAVYDSDDDARHKAHKRGIGDDICADIASCVVDADLVILAVPVGAMKDVMAEMTSYLKYGASNIS